MKRKTKNGRVTGCGVRLRRRLLLWCGGAWVVAAQLAASPALAQSPVTRLPEEDKGILGWVIALGIALLFAAPIAMNPKRSHLN